MLYLSIVSLMWAFSFGLIGSTLAGVDSLFVACFRLACASLTFLPFLRLRGIPLKQSLYLVGVGAIQFGLMYVCYIKAYQFIPSHLVALFSVLTPVYIILIHDLRQKKFTPKYLLAALLSVLGAAIIQSKTGSTESIWIGFALMQIAGLAFAFGQIAYRDWKLQNPTTQDHQIFALLYIGATLLALIACLCFTNWAELQPTQSQWIALLYLGIIASGLGFFMWNKGAARTNPGTLAAYNNAVVPLAVFCSLFVFGEITNSSSQSILRLIIGATLIASAVVLAQRGSARSQ
jgi:drug/metabolite transporter (DMT)-like permease